MIKAFLLSFLAVLGCFITLFLFCSIRIAKEADKRELDS